MTRCYSKVRDIHAVLEVTVYDEDCNKKSEFLGKIAIPLLRVRTPARASLSGVWVMYASTAHSLVQASSPGALKKSTVYFSNRISVRNVMLQKFMSALTCTYSGCQELVYVYYNKCLAQCFCSAWQE